MKFKSHSQRKAVMAKMRAQQNYPRMDFDGDGIPNKKDCDPFNPNKQGFLHNLQISRLKKQEEKIEKEREGEQKKLEDLKDTLKHKRAVAQGKASIHQVQLREKQAVIDELKREKRKAEDVRRQNENVKKELDKYTFTGKAKKFASNVWAREKEGARTVGKATGKAAKASAKATKKWWNDPENRQKRKELAKTSGKVLLKTANVIGDFTGVTSPPRRSRPRRRKKHNKKSRTTKKKRIVIQL